MKKYSLVFCIVICFLVSATLVFAAPIGKVILVEGRVDVLKTGRNVATPVSLGAPVDLGDVYRAKSNGRAEITFTNRNLMKIAPNTRIEITRYSVEGDKSNTAARLYRGRVQTVGADDFLKKAASFAEGNKFEVHTPNAVAGIRGTTMVVFFEKGATGALFLSGQGYMYNPQQPQQIVLIVAGTISFISAPGATPTPPRKASDAEMAMYTSMFTQGSSGGGGGGATPTGLAPLPGGGGGGGPDTGGNIQPLTPPPPVITTTQTTVEGPFYSNFNTDIWQTGSGLLWKGGMVGAFEGAESLWGSSGPLVTISGTYSNSATGTTIWSSTYPMWSWNEDTMTSTTSDGGSYVGFVGGADYNGILEGKFVGLYIDPSKNAGTLSAPVSGIYADGIFTMLGSINRTFKDAVSIDPVYFEANDTQDTMETSYLSGTFPATGGTISGSFGGTTLSIDDRPWGIYFLRAGGTYSLSAPSWNAKIGGYTKFGAYYNASSSLYHDDAYWIGNITNGTWGADKITGTLSGQYISNRRLGNITGDVIGTHNSGTSGDWQAVSLGTWTGTPLSFGNSVSPALRYYDPVSGWQTDGSFNGKMGGTSSIWSSSQSSQASFKIIAQYNPHPAGTHAVIWNDGNYSMNDIYNGLPDFYTTYDGGAYDMNIGAVLTTGGNISGRFGGIYIDPNGHAGLLRGSLTGTSYPDIDMLDVDGSIYRIERGSVYLVPNQLKDAMVYHGALPGRTTRLAGASPAGGTFAGATTDTFDNNFASFVDETNKSTYPWGYYRHTLGGTYTGTVSAWSGKTGGFHYFGDYYETPTTHTGSPGYWLADITNGTWGGDMIEGTVSGAFISATALGMLSGEVIGTYNTANNSWQAINIGVWSGSELKFFNSINTNLTTYPGTNDGTMTAYTGGVTPHWYGSAGVTIIGKYSPSSAQMHTFYQWIRSENRYDSTPSSYDGGSYTGFFAGAEGLNYALLGAMYALYSSPTGDIGYFKGSLSGTRYPDIGNMFNMSGTISATQMLTGWDPVIYDKNLWWTDDTSMASYPRRLAGRFSGGEFTSGAYDLTNIYQTLLQSLDYYPVARTANFGILATVFAGSYTGTPSTWSGRIGGYRGGFETYLYDPDPRGVVTGDGYWLGSVISGGWADRLMTGQVSGDFVSRTRVGDITGEIIGSDNNNGTFQSVFLGVWTGQDTNFHNDFWETLRYNDAGTMTSGGNFRGMLGGAASPFTQASAPFKFIGYYEPNAIPDHILATQVASFTRDGGWYSGYMGLSFLQTGTYDDDINGRASTLYATSDRKAGILQSDLTGTGFRDINMFRIVGEWTRQEKVSDIGFDPTVDWPGDYLQQGSMTEASSVIINGTFAGSGGIYGQASPSSNNTLAFITQPWGIYQLMLYGNYSNSAAAWSAKLGGQGTFGVYYNGSYQQDQGYWLLQTASDGTFGSNRMNADLTGSFITRTKLGTMSGDFLGTYAENTTWASMASGTTGLRGSTYGNGKFVAVGYSGILASPDGVTWTSVYAGSGGWGVTYGNGTFVAIGGSGNFLTSPDTTTWTSHAAGTTELLRGVTYGNSQFVAVGYNGTIVTSPDGVTWTPQSSGATQFLTGVTYGNGKFVAVGGSANFLTSTDGVTWTPVYAGIGAYGVTYANNTFVAVGNVGAIVTSTDGVIWVSQTSGTTRYLESVTYGNGKFIAVGEYGTILTSTDGVTWTPEVSGTTQVVYGVAYGNGKFVAVEDSAIIKGIQPWQAGSVGVWEGAPLKFVNNIPAGTPLNFFDGTYLSNDGSVDGGLMGGTTSLWTATQATPAAVKVIGAYTKGANNAHIWDFTIEKDGVSSPTINISLLPADWIEDTTYGWVSNNYYKETTGTGSLRVVRTAIGGGFGGGVNLRTADTYNFQDSIFRYKWKMNGQGTYAGTWNGPGAGFWGLGGNITTGWSYAGSTLINSDQWIYTELQINSDLSYAIDLSYTGYGLGGIYHTAGTLAQSSYDTLSDTWFRHRVVDNYANGAYFEIAEAMIHNYYDGGNYKGYLTGIDLNNSLEARMIALYIDPSGRAGYLKGSFTGTAYEEINMFEMDGSIYPVQKNAAIGINADNLDSYVWQSSYGAGNLAGTLGGGDITSSTGAVLFETMNIINTTTNIAENWGIYKFTSYGNFSNPSGATTWTGRAGGEGTFGAYYSTVFSDDYGRWITTITDGTWNNGRMTGALSGEFLTMTKMGTLSGELLGTYYNYSAQDLWQAVSVGSWTGTPLLFANEGYLFTEHYGSGGLFEYNGGLGFILGGTSSLFGAGPVSVTMIGSYGPGDRAIPDLWRSGVLGIVSPGLGNVWSYNQINGTHTTYDGGSYGGVFAGIRMPATGATPDTLEGRLYLFYKNPSGSTGEMGLLIGNLTGQGYADISMFTMNGSLNRVVMESSAIVEIITGGVSNISDPSPSYQTNPSPYTFAQFQSGGGTISFPVDIYFPWSYRQYVSGLHSPEEWGIVTGSVYGTYTDPTNDSWSATLDYDKKSTWDKIHQIDVAGTKWSDKKITGTTSGYGADVSGTPLTWISVGEVMGTFNPSTLKWQAVHLSAWIETNRFLAMADTVAGRTELQKLNIPCVQVGVDNLSYSAAGMTNINMDSVKFFAPTSGGKPQVWATGNVNANWQTGYQPIVNTEYNLAGTAVNAQFTLKQFSHNVDNSKWLANVSNGSGQINGYAITFKGAAAGTTNATAKTFSGTAAGTAK